MRAECLAPECEHARAAALREPCRAPEPLCDARGLQGAAGLPRVGRGKRQTQRLPRWSGRAPPSAGPAALSKARGPRAARERKASRSPRPPFQDIPGRRGRRCTRRTSGMQLLVARHDPRPPPAARPARWPRAPRDDNPAGCGIAAASGPPPPHPPPRELRRTPGRHGGKRRGGTLGRMPGLQVPAARGRHALAGGPTRGKPRGRALAGWPQQTRAGKQAPPRGPQRATPRELASTTSTPSHAGSSEQTQPGDPWQAGPPENASACTTPRAAALSEQTLGTRRSWTIPRGQALADPSGQAHASQAQPESPSGRPCAGRRQRADATRLVLISEKNQCGHPVGSMPSRALENKSWRVAAAG